MKKAGFIVALVAIIIDALFTAIIINLAVQLGVAITEVILPIALVAVMIVSISLVNKNKMWAYGIVAVGTYSMIANISNGTLLPILPIAEVVGGILILVDAKPAVKAAEQPVQQNKEGQ